MIKQIRTNDARRDYSVFLAGLSPAISETCPKIKHRWSKCEPYGLIMRLDIGFTGNSPLGIKKEVAGIKTFGSTINLASISALALPLETWHES